MPFLNPREQSFALSTNLFFTLTISPATSPGCFATDCPRRALFRGHVSLWLVKVPAGRESRSFGGRSKITRTLHQRPSQSAMNMPGNEPAVVWDISDERRELMAFQVRTRRRGINIRIPMNWTLTRSVWKTFQKSVCCAVQTI